MKSLPWGPHREKPNPNPPKKASGKNVAPHALGVGGGGGGGGARGGGGASVVLG